MAPPYRAALLTLFVDDRAPQIFLGDSVDQTLEAFSVAVAEHGATIKPGSLGVAFDAEGNEIRYLMARIVNGTAVGFVVRRPSGTTSIFLFSDPVSAIQFSSGFADSTIATVVPVLSNTVDRTAEEHFWLDKTGRAALREPDLAPLSAPAGFCPRCIIRPLSTDDGSSVVCPACKRLATLIREQRGV